jgi:hypothetical protein
LFSKRYEGRELSFQNPFLRMMCLSQTIDKNHASGSYITKLVGEISGKKGKRRNEERFWK